METAKVDIRKLQILNDRINQCIDALNQVRLSVHGLSHSGALQGPQGFSPQAFASPGFGSGVASPFGLPGIVQQPLTQGFGPGFSHSTGFMGGIGAFPPTMGWNPYLGLSHTSPEILEASSRAALADPFLVARIAQTFPYAQLPVPPVVTIY
jgi:hypothetical protein